MDVSPHTETQTHRSLDGGICNPGYPATDRSYPGHQQVKSTSTDKFPERPSPYVYTRSNSSVQSLFSHPGYRSTGSLSGFRYTKETSFTRNKPLPSISNKDIENMSKTNYYQSDSNLSESKSDKNHLQSKAWHFSWKSSHQNGFLPVPSISLPGRASDNE